MLLSRLEGLLEKCSSLPTPDRAPQEASPPALTGPACGGSDPAAAGFAAFLARLYGLSSLPERVSRLRRQCRRFGELYGDGPVSMLRAPARINVLGEHVDYVSYLPALSLSFGSREHDMVFVYRVSGRGRVRGASLLDGATDFEFDLSECQPPAEPADPAREWERYVFSRPSPVPHWASYVRGAGHFARHEYGQRISRGLDFLVDSNIPAAGGASSSSALTVLAGAALRRANQIACSPAALARESAQAEWFVGTRGGAMDHTTICLSRHDHALAISYALDEARLVPLRAPGFRWLTFFSHAASKGREVMLEYNERAAVSRILIPALIQDWQWSRPDLHQIWRSSLEEAKAGTQGALENLDWLLERLPEMMTLDEIARRLPAAFEKCRMAFSALVAERIGCDLKIRARALHHLGEVRRVAAALELLTTAHPEGEGEEGENEATMKRLGLLLDEAHASLRDLYDVCTPEVNGLIETVKSAPGVYGARVMGGGFGGNVLALVRACAVEAAAGHVQREFYGPRGRDATLERAVTVSTTGDGLSELDLDNDAGSAG